MTQKAVILAGGLGRRMRRADAGAAILSEEAKSRAEQGLKGLIPLRGRPFLDYVVGGLLEAGVEKVCLVVPPDCDALTDYARRTAELTGAEITWAVQSEPRGTGDAVLAAEDFAGPDPFIMCNCDTLCPQDAIAELAAVLGPGCRAVAFDRDALLLGSNFGADRIGRFAVLVISEGGELKEIVEKPRDPEAYRTGGKLWVSLNLFRFTRDIFEACRQIRPHPERGEVELTDAVSLLAAREDFPFRAIFSSGSVMDLTAREDVSAVERLLTGRCLRF